MNPISQARSLFPALKNPANRHKAVGFTPEEFHYAFTNTLSEEESRKVWDRYAIAAPGNWVWEYGLIRQLQARPPGHLGRLLRRPGAAAVHRGRRDHIMPPSSTGRTPSTTRSRRPSPTSTSSRDRDHWTCAAPGWEAVADHALDWALRP